MFKFSIAQWRAWAPGIDTPEDWQEWANSPYCPIGHSEPPSLGFLPPLQRRRLSPLARMAVGCAWALAEGLDSMPVVYASHHGETSRSFELLSGLAGGDPVSPTSFSLSVHNAIAGLWSIMRRDTAESVALSAEGDGLEAAIIEACLLLHAGHEAVLVVLAEERPPREYAPWIGDVPFSYAIALRLNRGADFRLTSESSDPRTDTDADAPAVLPHPLSLLRHLVLRTGGWRHAHPRRNWNWRRGA